MGGYAAYVWSAFAVALILLVGLFLQSRHAARRRELELEELRAKVRP
jgi:heme exporter protein CcmD